MDPATHTPSQFTDKQLQQALDTSNGSVTAAAEGLGLNRKSLQERVQNSHLKYRKGDFSSMASREKSELLRGLSDTFDRELARWPNALEQKEEVAAKVLAGHRAQKILVFADLHIPHQVTAFVRQMLRDDGDASWAFCLADFFNVDVASHFRKTGATHWQKEWDTGLAVATGLREQIRMVWLEGNHELRLLKCLADAKLDPELIAWLSDRGGALIQTLVRATRGKTAHGVSSPWMVLGDVFLGHMEDEHSTIPGRSATNVLDWAMWNVTETVQGSVQAHTHKQSWVRHHNRHAIECGCLCHQMDYVVESGRTGPNKREPWQRGYVVLYLDKEGRCEWQKTRMVPLEYRKEDYL